MAASSQLSSQQVEEYTTAFQFFDKESTGTLQPKDVKPMMRALGEDMTDSEITSMCGSGLTVDAFIRNRQERWAALRSVEVLKRAFAAFDRNRSGTIPADQLKYYLTSLGDRMTESEVDNLLKDAGAGPGGSVNYNAFVEKMLGAH
mmetsp:Transcript_32954/g.82815  ORF Transcript_32954/g.82815 Transcript_32954/m.82815 type:complete len:146 (-) Transcript_32954:103-540(-)|eukprot:CAMPEP_0177657896 /NCGR_PEP_ID=MMETSP0447-20121125/16483_1 /TAXON_ID=0 /ORGANISM="Stygamoeba regulata, Strain BSH-02190019" /LENGTH=145 /DNA_ID=CAMNT_0019162389 /DNA_START=191 /DNA_END=628 /DNA_ORIENTATION=+